MNLTNILRFNSLSTVPFAILLLIFNQWLGRYLGGVPSWFIVGLAIALIIFSVCAWLVSYKPKRITASLVNLMDIGWVLSTCSLIIIKPIDLPVFAVIVICLINVVGVFNIYFQTKGIKHL